METVIWVMILFTPPLVEASKIVNGSLGDACLYWGWSVRERRYVTSAKWDIEVSHWPPSSSIIISVLNETHFSRVNCVFDNYIYTRYKSANNLKWHMVSYSHFVARTKDIRVATAATDTLQSLLSNVISQFHKRGRPKWPVANQLGSKIGRQICHMLLT